MSGPASSAAAACAASLAAGSSTCARAHAAAGGAAAAAASATAVGGALERARSPNNIKRSARAARISRRPLFGPMVGAAPRTRHVARRARKHHIACAARCGAARGVRQRR